MGNIPRELFEVSLLQCVLRPLLPSRWTPVERPPHEVLIGDAGVGRICLFSLETPFSPLPVQLVGLQNSLAGPGWGPAPDAAAPHPSCDEYKNDL